MYPWKAMANSRVQALRPETAVHSRDRPAKGLPVMGASPLMRLLHAHADIMREVQATLQVLAPLLPWGDPAWVTGSNIPAHPVPGKP